MNMSAEIRYLSSQIELNEIELDLIELDMRDTRSFKTEK